MNNLFARILPVFLCLFFALPGLRAQLSLEAIFLDGKYYAKTAGSLACFHKQERYVQLRPSPMGQYLGIYDRQAQLVDTLPLYAWKTDNGLPQPRYSSVSISPDDVYFLLKANEEKMYRRSGAANYFLTGAERQLVQVGSGKLSFPDFSADGTKLAYVKYNNLYWYDIKSRTEYAVTNDGEWNHLINGKSDWVYEEEWELTQAFAWSPAGDKLAYLKFDESAVKDFPMPVYRGQTYPSAFTYKYPKVGEANSAVSGWIYDLKKQKHIAVELRGYSFEYIPRLYWNATGTEAWFMLMNRNQDTLQVVAYDVQSKKTRVVYTEYSDTYVKVPLVFEVLSDNSVILSSERDGYNQLYRLVAGTQQLQALTNGRFEVTTAYGVDETTHTIAFQSNEGQVSGRKVFMLDYVSGKKTILAAEPGTNDAVFAPNLKWYFLTHSSGSSPYRVQLASADNTPAMLLQDNAELRMRLADVPEREFMTLPVNGDTLDAWLFKPRFSDSSKRYPLLIYVYGGPGNQEVLDKWGGGRDLWFAYLAQQGIAVACVDNRGSGGKGAAFERAVFLKLGQLEVADQVKAAAYFGQLPYIDSTRIGIYGASYGGYMAALCMLHGQGVFKAGIAQSPVTDWRLYDNVYTERYMRTPERNPEGYAQYCPVQEAYKLNGSLLLVHGLSDDNVHFQHSLEFIRSLNEAHRFYDLYLYPDNDHGISGGETRYDLYLKLTRYLQEHL